MKQPTVTEFGAWIEFQRNDTDKKFFWIDGTPLEGKYQNWDTKTNELSNDDGVEECGHMWGQKSSPLQESGMIIAAKFLSTTFLITLVSLLLFARGHLL